jgi:hypothetical protein
MKPEGVGFTADYPGDLLNALAIGLAADTSESAKKSLDVVRARSPELLRMSEQTGDDMPTSSVGFTEVLLMSLRSDIELPWPHFEQRAREEGRCGVHKVRRVRCRTRKRSLSSPKQGPVTICGRRDGLDALLAHPCRTRRDRNEPQQRGQVEAEVLALRRQVQVLERQIKRVRWEPGDRMIPAALRERLPRSAWATLLVQPETVLGWHRELVRAVGSLPRSPADRSATSG